MRILGEFRVPGGEKLFLNWLVGKDSNGYERVHGGNGYGVKSEIGYMILDFRFHNVM